MTRLFQLQAATRVAREARPTRSDARARRATAWLKWRLARGVPAGGGALWSGRVG